MSKNSIDMLGMHRARIVDKEDRKTDLIVWITNSENVGYVDSGCETKKTRAERMVKRAEALQSALLVIQERDQGHDAKDRRSSTEELLAAYRQQGMNLGKHMWMVYRFIRSQIDETTEVPRIPF